jgi:hypothetical protein
VPPLTAIPTEMGKESRRERPRVGARVLPPHPFTGVAHASIPGDQFVLQMVGGNMVGAGARAACVACRQRAGFEPPKPVSDRAVDQWLTHVLTPWLDRG